MIALYIVLGILGVILVLAVVCAIRAARCKPPCEAKRDLEQTEDARAIQYAQKLSKLIQQETVSSYLDADKTKFYAFHQLLEQTFPKLHAVCERHVFNGSLLFKWPGQGKGEPIMLMSHHDVVAADGNWEHAPFSGDIAQGLLWGRGTQDTKSSLFCFLTAVEELIGEGYTPACDVYLASSCTEEVFGEGAPLTAQYLKDNGVHLRLLLDEGGAILREPIPGVNGVFALLGVLEKGYGDVKFIAHSNGGHASTPVKRSPIPRLAAFVSDVEKHDPFVPKLHPTVREMYRRMAPYMSFGMRMIFCNLWLFSGLVKKLMPSISAQGAAMLKTTCAFTTAKGSDGLNVLPQEAYVTANMRFIHHQPTDESIAIMRRIAAKYQVETEVMYKDNPCPIVDYQSDVFQMVESAVREQFGAIGVCPYPMTGGTDCKYYTDVCENAIRFAPIYMTRQQMASVHGINENITIAALPDAVDFYKKIIRKAK